MTDSIYPTIGTDEAWRRIAAAIAPLPPRPLCLAEALGCVLAEDVVAAEDVPPFAASAMDGYAVVAADASVRRRLVGEQDAGPIRQMSVAPGTAARIMTGAALPAGADAVIPVERAEESDGHVTLPGAVHPGGNVRPVGQDIARGDTVLAAGALLGPAEIGLLASLGRTAPPVHPKPRVAVMATGDELVAAEARPGPGRIRDSNSHALAAAVEAAGCVPVPLGRFPDDEGRLGAAILDGVARADMLLTSGGVSMGRRDFVKPLLAQLGEVRFGRVAMKPGKPLTFARVRGVPVFGLPGFPVSSLVTFEMFVRPALRLLAARRRLWRPEVPVRLLDDLRHERDRTEFQRARVEFRDGVYWAGTTGSQVSGRLKSLVGANALLRLPAGSGDYQAGDEVTAIMIEHPEVEPA